MSNYISTFAIREVVLGTLVVKTGITFPQGAPGTSTLFTVSGGSVMVTSLFGVVSTAVASTDPQLSLGITPAGTASTTSLATSVALTSREVGTWVGLTETSAKAGALLAGTNGSTVLFVQNLFPLASGALITQTAQVAETGAITWYLTYSPLDTGASVA